ncbi:MAG: hypothetical protein K5650_07280 [Bacteroidales bacterium]|nr:hypothetical protein [Bacteroidales bacterium]
MRVTVHEKILTTACLLLALNSLCVQSQIVADTTHRRVQTCFVSQYGTGYATFVDHGTSPLPYQGLTLRMSTGLEVRWKSWLLEVGTDISGAIYSRATAKKPSISAYGGMLNIEVGGLHCLAKHGRWQLWAGVAVADMAEMRYNSSLNNSSNTTDNFLIPQLRGRAEYKIQCWQLHTALAVAPTVWAYRPGYAFIENYSSVNSEVIILANNYRWSATPLGYISTSLGATLNMKHGNSLGISYKWQLIHTGSNDAHRMVLADHTLVITFKYIIG